MSNWTFKRLVKSGYFEVWEDENGDEYEFLAVKVTSYPWPSSYVHEETISVDPTTMKGRKIEKP